MKQELLLFKALLSLSVFRRYASIVQPLVQNQRELFLIFEALTSFFDKYERDCASVQELETYFLSLNINLSEVDKEYYHALFTNISKASVAPEVVESLLDALLRKGKLVELAVAAYEASDGRQDVEVVT